MIKILKEKQAFYNHPKFVLFIRVGMWVFFLYMAYQCREASINCPYAIQKEDGSRMTQQEMRDIIKMYEILKQDPDIPVQLNLTVIQKEN